ncbi:capsular biosynthesis protein [Desulfurispira natronophila]|uniref:Glycosyltransferase n=1 Tax=Desulfurispira natronophila TaxID=682562 RepID=A0A7W8DH22_9BACT|nr:capsular biosynthesis protein [Desulfurispira natronophila]MBB5021959.1 hypothetical protein [Desulfurispira natronophila]
MNIAVVCEADPAKCPRPSRLISHLKKTHNVTAIGRSATSIDGVKVLSYSPPKKRTLIQECVLYWNVLWRRYEKLVYIPTRQIITEHLMSDDFDIIFCHDIKLLPIVIKFKKRAKVVFDAREFYPGQMEDNLRWCILTKPFFEYLCKAYIPQVDYSYTVSCGIANLYRSYLDSNFDVLESTSHYFDLVPSVCSNKKIKLIHHGAAHRNREIHKMIEMMDFLDERFDLELMLVLGQADYMLELVKMCNARGNVSIVEPVANNEIVPVLNRYDVGVYLLSPTGRNTQYALPNKFFEFMQSRLAIAIGPSPDMKGIVEKYLMGVVSDDFSPRSLANMINKLTDEKIMKFKQNSDKAAKVFNCKRHNNKIDAIIEAVTK